MLEDILDLLRILYMGNEAIFLKTVHGLEPIVNDVTVGFVIGVDHAPFIERYFFLYKVGSEL